MTARAIDPDRLREALTQVSDGDIEGAIDRLAPMVQQRRFTRPSGRAAEALELDEITGWLTLAVEDPTSADARFYVERAYYKLRRYRSEESPGRG